MHHRDAVERYTGTLSDLAVDIGDLRYDALEKLLRSLAAKLEADSDGDAARGRPQLAEALRSQAHHVARAADDAALAWRISEPHM